MDEEWCPPWAARPRVSPEALSLHQQDIAALIAEGLSDLEIARVVASTHEAVVAVIEDILQRLGVERRCSIAAWAADAGLVVQHPDRGRADWPAP